MTADQVVSGLRLAIQEGDYPPGMPLDLQNPAATFGVSMLPVLEALRRLAFGGLVTVVPSRGRT